MRRLCEFGVLEQDAQDLVVSGQTVALRPAPVVIGVGE